MTFRPVCASLNLFMFSQRRKGSRFAKVDNHDTLFDLIIFLLDCRVEFSYGKFSSQM